MERENLGTNVPGDWAQRDGEEEGEEIDHQYAQDSNEGDCCFIGKLVGADTVREY